jgi:hypothetical protein
MGRGTRRLGEETPSARSVVATHLLADAVLAGVLAAFDEAKIEALPVKGIITATQLYADVRERPLTDIDLRVAPRDLARVVAVAERHGWAVHRVSPRYGNVVFDMGGLSVDVEAAVGPPGL